MSSHSETCRSWGYNPCNCGADAPREFRASVPVKTTNPLNGSWGNWRGPAAKRKKQRGLTKLVLDAERIAQAWPQVRLPVDITLVRVAPSNGLDDDALPASLKAIRDGVTDWLGLRDDRTPDIRWLYDQRRGPRGAYAVEITIKER